jgi:predicted neutral ceramidase superfamily lipid hydrolase
LPQPGLPFARVPAFGGRCDSKGLKMSDRGTLLKFALIVFGAAFCLIYPLAVFWPSGWAWHAGAPYESDYFMMIVGVYATLGVFLILASRNPAANRSLILFAIVSSLVHAAIMAWQSFKMPEHMGHLYGDVPALVLIGVVLAALLPAAGKS